MAGRLAVVEPAVCARVGAIADACAGGGLEGTRLLLGSGRPRNICSVPSRDWLVRLSIPGPGGRTGASGLVGTGEPHRVLGPPFRHAHEPRMLVLVLTRRASVLGPEPGALPVPGARASVLDAGQRVVFTHQPTV